MVAVLAAVLANGELEIMGFLSTTCPPFCCTRNAFPSGNFITLKVPRLESTFPGPAFATGFRDEGATSTGLGLTVVIWTLGLEFADTDWLDLVERRVDSLTIVTRGVDWLFRAGLETDWLKRPED